jgi:biotin operon repressor
MTADDAVVSAYLHGRDCDGEASSQRQLAAQLGVSRARVAT